MADTAYSVSFTISGVPLRSPARVLVSTRPSGVTQRQATSSPETFEASIRSAGEYFVLARSAA